ncbi:FKBP-type peptidyl-prolyl cis-trans isomerase [Limibacter armeniacum]|uniref:FKBP-type peptidyl-prolyl cis-trans isomerase n=1 Tax=Limibacter armeniacum TaxID=466084 RepID=UPI002FE599F9
MKIEAQKPCVVTLHYKMYVDNGDNIEYLFEEKDENDPLTVLYATGYVLPNFEEKIVGKAKGDEFDIHLSFEEAFGNYDEEKIIFIPMSAFEGDEKFDRSQLQKGSLIPMMDDLGQQHIAEVMEVEEDRVQMDFNHPLAGYDLHYQGKIADLREATKEEIDHKHVHGPDGHCH